VTALNPLKGEHVRVRGVASEKYPTNDICAHPDCTEKGESDHHIFPRGLTKSKSYFVELHTPENDRAAYPRETTVVIPHVVRLCGSGTTGHHGDVEEHRAWIKYEDGQFVWYDWLPGDKPISENGPDDWVRLGPLNPQPAKGGKPKRKRHKGEARRNRKTVSIRVPDDAGEDGAALLDEGIETLEEKIMQGDAHRPIYYTLMSALDYTNLNADATDFE